MTIDVNEGITLELLGEQHVVALYELTNRNRDYLREWLPWVDMMQTVDGFKKYVQVSQRRLVEKAEIGYVIRVGGVVVGRIGLYHFDHQNKIASIGYWLGQEYQGKGIVTHACRRLIRLGFTELGLNRLEIKCATGNVKSRAVPERLHFTREGVIRQGELHKDRFVDIYLYSLLREEWRED